MGELRSPFTFYVLLNDLNVMYMETLQLLEQEVQLPEVLDVPLCDDMIAMLQESGFDMGYYLMLEEVYDGTE